MKAPDLFVKSVRNHPGPDTYAGNPLAVAASHAVLDVMQEEQLLQRSNDLGERLRTFLKAEAQKHACIADVRGPGSMVAVEFKDPATGAPDAQVTARVLQYALSKGLLLSCGLYGNVIRFLYPLTIPDAQFNQSLQVLGEAIAHAAA